MPAHVAIVHGWSDTSKSFEGLREYLVASGHDVTQIWLGDYVSTDDDVRVEDVAKRMEAVLRQSLRKHRLVEPFDLIVHSTGGLVAREWLAQFYPQGTGCPAKRIVMLAPANFGSPLAAKGKSMIGRIGKGWDNWFQTGTGMLNALELASPYQWNLARRDLFDAGDGHPGPYGEDKLWPFVIVGTRGYPSGLKRMVNEDGSDGTVRAPAANLNAVGLTIDFATDHRHPRVTPWPSRNPGFNIPFAILPDRDHSSIHRPAADTQSTAALANRLGKLINDALACNSPARYRQMHDEWRRISDDTHDLATNVEMREKSFTANEPPSAAFHQYMQVVVNVRDDYGQPVDDYFLEFFAPGGDDGEDDAEIYFQRSVLEDVHVNGQMPSLRCLFADRTDLLNGFYKEVPDGRPKELAVSISAANPGPNVRYFDQTRIGAKGEVVVHALAQVTREGLGAERLLRNTTHLIEIVIPRKAVDKVFKLSP